MNPTTRSNGTEATREQKELQAQLVASAVLNEGCREVYKRRLIPGHKAASIRDAVRETVVEGLRRSRTHAEVAEAAALAVDRAIAVAGITVQKVGTEREGWRSRLAMIEATLAGATEFGESFGSNDVAQNGHVIADAAMLATALDEIRSMIDGIHEE